MKQLQAAIIAMMLLTSAVTSGEMTIRDVQRTYTPWGPARATPEYYLPQDQIIMPFVVDGVDLDSPDDVRLDLSVSLINGSGKTVLLKTFPVKGKPVLKGKSLWSVAMLPLTAGLEPGAYKVHVEVEDPSSKEKASFERSIDLKKPDLSFPLVQFFHDQKLTSPAGYRAQLGQPIHFRALVRGLDNLNGMYQVTQAFSILDAKTKKQLHERKTPPQNHNLKRAGAIWTVQGQTGLLTRSGKFILRITVTDEIAKRTISTDVPFEVMEP